MASATFNGACDSHLGCQVADNPMQLRQLTSACHNTSPWRPWEPWGVSSARSRVKDCRLCEGTTCCNHKSVAMA